MFGWTKKKSEFLDKAIRKANEEEQRIRIANQELFDRGRVLYEQRQLEVKRMERAAQIRRAEHNKNLAELLDKSITEEIKNTPTRTLINVDTGETRIYKRIGGEEVLVAHYENRIYGRDDNRL